MTMKKSIFFLHLSDIHINKEKDISDEHIRKIVDSLKSYKSINIINIIIIISGDITQSGENIQFLNAGKMIGSLITGIRNTFGCNFKVLIVPGNHDVNHAGKPLDISYLKEDKYNEVESQEHYKLSSFYNYAKFNKCFKNSEIYYDTQILNINGVKIKVNLINNGIFSTRNEYKGLLYMPNDCIDKLSDRKDADFVISIMHHAPDYYRELAPTT